MKIVLAPDSYKGSLSANEVVKGMRQAIESLPYQDTIIEKPMADGGEGTVDALTTASRGQKIHLTCTGPLGTPIETYYAMLPDHTAVIEVANIAGLTQVPIEKRNPDDTTSYGLGEVIRDALDRGASSLIIGLGGSATNDGGLGMLQALGMEANQQDGTKAGIYGKDLHAVKEVKLEVLDQRLKRTSIQVACDVANPLVGENGASAVYGPQKGSTENQIAQYDQTLAQYAKLIETKQRQSYQSMEGSGAAGGLGFAMLVLGADLVSGAKLVAEAGDLEIAIKEADLVITGEGQSDEQTLYGKAPGYIADLANRYNTPVILLSGSLTGKQDPLRNKFAGCFSIINEPLAVETSMAKAKTLVTEQMKHIRHFISHLKHN
ncbi:glycerate kinase [Oceanobacillus halotolerans]|uniref:glycerate kinase n=1 Tax=Oceanobacillus halotolerans TaxID=2663380 RepID=UPI0013DC05B4|nr:glycerate kinase [Oceanobacillus halotolerans]